MSEPGDFKARGWSVHPPYLHESYKSTALRSPSKPLVPLAQTLSEPTGPVFGHDALGPLDDDLTRNGAVNGESLGERFIVAGRVLDEAGRRATLVAERRGTPGRHRLPLRHPASGRSGDRVLRRLR